MKKNYVIATIIGVTLLIPSIYFYFREDTLPSCELGSSISSVQKKNGMTLVAKRRKEEETYSSPKETVKVYSVTAEGEQNSGIGATKFRAGDEICAVSIRRGSEEVLKVTVNTRAVPPRAATASTSRSSVRATPFTCGA